MRKILSLLLIVSTALLWSCDSMYDRQAEFEGEIVYPAKFDTIVGHIGFERVEIDLLKAGRISSKQINMGKAKKTVVEYDDQKIVIDSLVSYVNIKNLKQPKLYRFRVYTIDEYENKSVPQEIALIPFTKSDLEAFAIAPPRVMSSPSAAVIDWPNGISSVLLNYYGLSFEYTDKDGVVRKGVRGTDSRFFVGGLNPGQSVDIKMEYKIIPKVNRVPIIDTVYFADKITVKMPTSSTPFPAAERSILEANGVTTFTADGVAAFTKLVYPVHANTLQDLFYFPNLKVLDLTGADKFKLPELVYDRNSVRDVIGGGNYAPFMRKVSDISSGNQQALKDLLEAGMLEKVYYRPNTMGLDKLLTPYVDKGIVELVHGPSSVMVENQFQLNGIVQDNNWTIDITYPATDAPAGEGLENIYKLVLKKRSASFVLALPREYQFNVKEYKYLQMKIYAPNNSYFQGSYAPYKCFWVRVMNRMWSFAGNSDFGQEYWDMKPPCLDDNSLEKWIDIKIDLSGALGKHNRVIVFNIGQEPNFDFKQDIPYYISNIRFTKE